MDEGIKITFYKRRDIKLFNFYKWLSYTLILLLIFLSTFIFVNQYTLPDYYYICSKPTSHYQPPKIKSIPVTAPTDSIHTNKAQLDTTQHDTTTVILKTHNVITESSRNSSPKDSLKPIKHVLHKVESGQTLYSISRLYKVSIDDLKKLNNLKNNIIVVNSKIKVKRKS